MSVRGSKDFHTNRLKSDNLTRKRQPGGPRPLYKPLPKGEYARRHAEHVKRQAAMGVDYDLDAISAIAPRGGHS